MYAARELQYTAAGEEVQVPGVAFTSNGRLNEEIDTRIGEENAVMREICRSVVTKLELSNTAKLSVFKSVIFPYFTYGHESWVMKKRMLFHPSASGRAVFEKDHDVKLHNNFRRGAILKSLNLKPISREIPALIFQQREQNIPR